MNFIFDTNIVHIDEITWADEDKRDDFLEYFLKCLNFVDTYENSFVYWSDQLESILWDSPTLPPWRVDQDFKNKIVPILYTKFLKSKYFIEVNGQYDECELEPHLEQTDRYAVAFKALCGSLMSQGNTFSMILSLHREVPTNSMFGFSCSSTQNAVTFKGENNLVKWLENDEFINYIWPNSVDDLIYFQKIVEICTSMNLNIHKFIFTNEFINSILDLSLRFKKSLIKAIKDRLIMTGSEAASSYLKEETINGIMRVRVTARPTSTRLHFIFQENKIIFKQYYREGEHDDGL